MAQLTVHLKTKKENYISRVGHHRRLQISSEASALCHNGLKKCVQSWLLLESTLNAAADSIENHIQNRDKKYIAEKITLGRSEILGNKPQEIERTASNITEASYQKATTPSSRRLNETELCFSDQIASFAQ